MFYLCYLYSFTHTGVQHDFHIRWCSFVVCMRVHLLFMLFVFACVKWCQFFWIDNFLIASSVFYYVNSCRLIVVQCVLHVEKKFTPVFSGVCVARTLLFCVMFYGLLFLVVFVFFHSAIIFSVILRFTMFITHLVSSSFSLFFYFNVWVLQIWDSRCETKRYQSGNRSHKSKNRQYNDERKRTKMKNDL